MTSRRASDEVSLDIVIALVAGVSVGIVLAAIVGIIGWLLGDDLTGLAEGFGLAGATVGTVVTLRKLQSSTPRAG